MSQLNYPNIPFKAYRFYFDTDGPIRLPEYPGSAWRGTFGHALKRTVCVVRNTPCSECLLKNACAYSYVFETPPPPNTEKMHKYTAIPHPFVFRFNTHETDTAESSFCFDINLFGHGQRFFPYIIHALQTAGQEGVGRQRQSFRLDKIDEVDFQGQTHTIYQQGQLQTQEPPKSPVYPKIPEKIAINFHSPIPIKQDNKNLATDHFNFGALFSTLLRRISMISYFHTDMPLETDFAGLTARAKTLSFSDQILQWYDWTRYSSRQQTEMNMGGLIGSISLDASGLDDFWPYLWLGQWTHVGKGTSMGMGAYTIQLTSLSTADKMA